jgi:hypothetical protein
MRLLCVVTVMSGFFLTTANNSSAQAAKDPDGYLALIRLFQQWWEFEHPVMRNNVLDYSAWAMAAKAQPCTNGVSAWMQLISDHGLACLFLLGLILLYLRYGSNEAGTATD